MKSVRHARFFMEVNLINFIVKRKKNRLSNGVKTDPES